MAIESDRADILSGVRAGRDARRPGRDADRESRLAELAVHDARRRRRRRRTRRRRPPGAGHAAAAGPCRSRRRREVRAATTCATSSNARARAKPRRGSRPARSPRQLLRARRHPASPATCSRSAASSLPDHAARDRSTRAAALPDDAPLRCVDAERRAAMIAEIDRAREAGDTLGGAFEVIATGVPLGLGSYVQWDRKLDGRLAQALMSIPAIKAVGIGIGPEAAASPRIAGARRDRPRRRAPDRRPAWRARPTTPAASKAASPTAKTCACPRYMKPISTLMKPLRSVDLSTMSRVARRDRAQRRLRGAGGGGRRRGDGRARARRRAARALRRRLGRRPRARA